MKFTTSALSHIKIMIEKVLSLFFFLSLNIIAASKFYSFCIYIYIIDFFQLEDLVKDQNGNHVIQIAVKVMNIRIVQNMAKKVLENDLLKQYTTHSYGCRIVQRIMEKSKGFDEDLLDQINVEIMNQFDTLIIDQYGNYVLQHVAQYSPKKHRDALMQVRNKKIKQTKKTIH